jgi:serine/threonine protein kinase
MAQAIKQGLTQGQIDQAAVEGTATYSGPWKDAATYAIGMQTEEAPKEQPKPVEEPEPELKPAEESTKPAEDKFPMYLNREEKEPSHVEDESEEPEEDVLEQKYEIMEAAGSGVFGTVFRARCRETQEDVALKKLNFDHDEFDEGMPSHVIREVSLLRDFEHPNVVRLLDVVLSENLKEYTLVFEYIEEDLYKHMKTNYRKHGKFMPLDLVQKYAKDLMSGIHACHVRLIAHRDLKPQNILVGQDGLKICDFGLARILPPGINKPQTHEVVTLWYRAPEILLGTSQYGVEVDMWSVGCVIAEMVAGLPIFAGDSEVGTIMKIFRLLGTPTEEVWPGIVNLENWCRQFPRWPPSNLQPLLDKRPEFGEVGTDLLRGLLWLNPSARITSRRSLKHSYFLQSQENISLNNV